MGEDGGFADDLDLLRYLFTTYWAGLPCRRQWSSKQQKWFQTVALRAIPWRLWVGGDLWEHAGSGLRRTPASRTMPGLRPRLHQSDSSKLKA